ncbi:MAG: aminomethyl-transferring glycine dehydrogenase [Granulosicoccus sp.]
MIPKATFKTRHIGPNASEIDSMLKALQLESLEELVAKVVPDSIAQRDKLQLDNGTSEAEALAELKKIAKLNVVKKSLLGQGYYDCHTPSVIQRNVFENPSWYTAYTPYQPEIAQGRLEVLFNFQTLISELTALPIANASLLDEATAAAEAMSLAHRALRGKRNTILVDSNSHPQTLDVMQTRALPAGIHIEHCSVENMPERISTQATDIFAILLQYPGSNGDIPHVEPSIGAAKEAGVQSIVAADLLALTLLAPPGDWGADIAIGSAQRFGVPMGFGGPHAAYMAVTEQHKRSLPGRLVGQSLTADGKPAYRLALQTREQHIRREKATSNICTAQALLAIMATLYACHHGPEGLRNIALTIRRYADSTVAILRSLGFEIVNSDWFDTISIRCVDTVSCLSRLSDAGYNARYLDKETICISIDETTSLPDIRNIVIAIADTDLSDSRLNEVINCSHAELRPMHFMSQPCFHDYHSETDMMRYLRVLASKDIALDQSMIPLGSCTMKLNAAAEMAPVSWPEFSDIHPFAPAEQTQGYKVLIENLEQMLCACTGYDRMSLQPNAGSQGEYAGLLAIRRYHDHRGDSQRNICLIPSSAHGTNPASAQMAGMRVVVVKCDSSGNVDIEDLKLKLEKHGDQLAAIMITYPSTHGVFESSVTDICERVHQAGGQVYIDGANLNAMVGTAQPGKFGGDVSHLNLHKTFCIPHGGGGPGVGPIGVGEHLAPWLPGHRHTGDATGVVSAAPWGSAMILPITWMYIRMMGGNGLRQATQVAILNANYIAKRLSPTYPILYRGEAGLVAHECILDTRKLKAETGITVDDIAKRLMDYGFHAPTMSFPVAGTLMVEPTESESLKEIDRFCSAMISIHDEAMKIAQGQWPAEDNPLVNAPHTMATLAIDDWQHPYSRSEAVFPEHRTDDYKYWPPVSRIDNVYGDKNLICSCPPIESYADTSANRVLTRNAKLPQHAGDELS